MNLLTIAHKSIQQRKLASALSKSPFCLKTEKMTVRSRDFPPLKGQQPHQLQRPRLNRKRHNLLQFLILPRQNHRPEPRLYLPTGDLSFLPAR